MNCPILRAGLILGALSIGLVGCHSAPKQTRQTAKKSSPDDPTSWSGTAISRGDKDDDASSAAGSPKSILKPGRLSGAMSSEGSDIERSLGVH